MDTEVQSDNIWVRRGEAAGWSLLCCFAAVAFCAAIPQNSRTHEGFLTQLLAALSGYLAVRCWRDSPRLRDSVRYCWLVRHFGECLLALFVLLVLAAILFPVFARPHSPRRYRVFQITLVGFLRGRPDGRVPQWKTQEEVRRDLAPYVRSRAGYRSKQVHEPFWISDRSGYPILVNTTLAGQRWADITSDANTDPVLAWDSQENPHGAPDGSPCRWVAYVRRGSDCISAVEWEKVRPRW